MVGGCFQCEHCEFASLPDLVCVNLLRIPGNKNRYPLFDPHKYVCVRVWARCVFPRSHSAVICISCRHYFAFTTQVSQSLSTLDIVYDQRLSVLNTQRRVLLTRGCKVSRITLSAFLRAAETMYWTWLKNDCLVKLPPNRSRVPTQFWFK